MEEKRKESKFTYIDENGNKIECDILFTFDLKKTGKNYIIFTDNTTFDDGSIKTYARTYDPNSDVCDLGNIETDEEWKMIEAILASLVKNE